MQKHTLRRRYGHAMGEPKTIRRSARLAKRCYIVNVESDTGRRVYVLTRDGVAYLDAWGIARRYGA